jgi:hypothetical protein
MDNVTVFVTKLDELIAVLVRIAEALEEGIEMENQAINARRAEDEV